MCTYSAVVGLLFLTFFVCFFLICRRRARTNTAGVTSLISELKTHTHKKKRWPTPDDGKSIIPMALTPSQPPHILTKVWMKSPAGTVTLVPSAAVINHVTTETGSDIKIPVFRFILFGNIVAGNGATRRDGGMGAGQDVFLHSLRRALGIYCTQTGMIKTKAKARWQGSEKAGQVTREIEHRTLFPR